MKPRLYIFQDKKRKKFIPAWKNFILNSGVPIGDQQLDRHLETYYNARFVCDWLKCYVEFESNTDLEFFKFKWTDYV